MAVSDAGKHRKKLPDEGVALSLGLPALFVCVRVSESERKEKKI